MLPKNGDTIAAIATARGTGGIGIIRLSGPLAKDIAQKIIKHPIGKTKLIPNKAVYASFVSGCNNDYTQEIIDRGIAIFFKAPNSFTGEDVLELQAHGGLVILDLLLRQTLKLGARIAEPGEFSRRAFSNGKMDLVQAESIVSLINAQTEQAAIAAAKSLQGDFSKQINQLLQDLIGLRMHIEAAIDFPEDQIDLLEIDKINSQLIGFKMAIHKILQQAKQGSLLSNGIKVVILGKPNVGKSSLLNLLSGEERAIVTEIPGTTRDVLLNKINLDGLIMDFADTAGIRSTDDVVEKIGIKKAIKEAEIADLILWMIDAKEFLTNKKNSINNFLPTELISTGLANKKIIILVNKIDQIDLDLNQDIKFIDDIPIVFISVTNHLGIDSFKQQIKKTVDFNDGLSVFTAKTRHVHALRKVYDCTEQATKVFSDSHKYWELLAEELKLAQEYLSQITGVFTNEDLLSKIFAEFCIGK